MDHIGFVRIPAYASARLAEEVLDLLDRLLRRFLRGDSAEVHLDGVPGQDLGDRTGSGRRDGRGFAYFVGNVIDKFAVSASVGR